MVKVSVERLGAGEELGGGGGAAAPLGPDPRDFAPVLYTVEVEVVIEVEVEVTVDELFTPPALAMEEDEVLAVFLASSIGQ